MLSPGACAHNCQRPLALTRIENWCRAGGEGGIVRRARISPSTAHCKYCTLCTLHIAYCSTARHRARDTVGALHTVCKGVPSGHHTESTTHAGRQGNTAHCTPHTPRPSRCILRTLCVAHRVLNTQHIGHAAHLALCTPCTAHRAPCTQHTAHPLHEALQLTHHAMHALHTCSVRSAHCADRTVCTAHGAWGSVSCAEC